MRIIYLHGFASGPSSSKARFFQAKLAQHGILAETPDLAEGDFEHLTITRQLAVLTRLADGEPVSLMGSSMGGYLAALYASMHPEVLRLVLLAPAFYFNQRWPVWLGDEKLREWKRTGKLSFFHHAEGCQRDLDYGIIQDCAQYDPAPAFQQPALIFHGTRDDVVPAALSEEYAASHPNVRLRLLDSDHQLTDMTDLMWEASREFLLEG